ncbi:MAG: YARHG domain-containing protein [Chitinophagaceae bacterium]|nr:YARHG domain-containing protein [Chitinophagaceae bacterium]
MKQLFNISLVLAAFTVGCQNNIKQKVTSGGTETVNAETSVASPKEKLLGSYVGNFGTNKITLLITKAAADSVEGRSIVGGNDRPFSGVYRYTGGVYNITAKEPGDDAHDGTFEFRIDEKNMGNVEGQWTPNRATETITPKVYSLMRRAFVYNTDGGDYPEASQKLLKEEDLENLDKYDLEMMRNEIFARHGYCFRKKNLRQLFEDKDWYIPNTVDIRNDLTEIEKRNIIMIKKYEKYAEEYGDDFGR